VGAVEGKQVKSRNFGWKGVMASEGGSPGLGGMAFKKGRGDGRKGVSNLEKSLPKPQFEKPGLPFRLKWYFLSFMIGG